MLRFLGIFKFDLEMATKNIIFTMSEMKNFANFSETTKV